MDDLIIGAIRQRLQTKATDLGSPRARLNLADPVGIANDESQLGFAFPPLMQRIYTEIGNGGFGPGYGLIGLTNGVPDDMGKTSVDLYRLFRGKDADDPDWKWPQGLLPVCHWGCAILSCVDCSDPNFRMRIFDPNVHDGDDWTDSFFEASPSFEAWIGAWASGIDLWEMMYGENGHIRRILTARHPDRA